MTTSNFDISQIPHQFRAIDPSNGDCFFGVNIAWLHDCEPLQTVPEDCVGFHFYFGDHQQALLESYLDSHFPQQTQRLYIGRSEDTQPGPRDYSSQIQSLTGCLFRKLQELWLGIDDLLCNRGSVHYNLGPLDSLSKCVPNLEILYLYGSFSLSSPMQMENLRDLTVFSGTYLNFDDLPPLTSETASNLLLSDLSSLERFSLDLENHTLEPCYRIPAEMLNECHWERLKYFELSGRFPPKDKLLLLDWLGKGRKVSFSVEEMISCSPEAKFPD